MFDLPNAKRVRRDELLSRDSLSRSPSPQPESAAQDAQQRLAELLNLDALIAPAESSVPAIETGEKIHGDKQGPEVEEEEEEQEFEFRLFSAAPKPNSKGGQTTTTTTDKDATASRGTQKLRIRIRSPTPGAVDGEGRFVNPFRGWQYYFATQGLLTGSVVEEDPFTAERRKQFETVAVTGQQMLDWSKVSWPGCHLPWRVIRLQRQHIKLPPASKDQNAVATVCVPDPPARVPTSRKKPGKKRRLQLRKRLTEAEEAKKKEAEKRNRKNRERKIKRRQKARELKAAAAAASGQSQGVADSEMKDASDASD